MEQIPDCRITASEMDTAVPPHVRRLATAEGWATGSSALETESRTSSMVTFHLAEDDKELVASFRLRHSIWADSGWMEPKDGKMDVDAWDALRLTKHFIAADENGDVIGTARILRDSAIGFRYESFAALPSDI